MDIIMMFYRIGSAERRAANPDHRLSQWQNMVVGEFNSEKTDGETFDLIRHYQEADEGRQWEVFLVPATLPA